MQKFGYLLQFKFGEIMLKQISKKDVSEYHILLMNS